MSPAAGLKPGTGRDLHPDADGPCSDCFVTADTSRVHGSPSGGSWDETEGRCADCPSFLVVNNNA